MPVPPYSVPIIVPFQTPVAMVPVVVIELRLPVVITVPVTSGRVIVLAVVGVHVKVPLTSRISWLDVAVRFKEKNVGLAPLSIFWGVDNVIPPAEFTTVT